MLRTSQVEHPHAAVDWEYELPWELPVLLPVHMVLLLLLVVRAQQQIAAFPAAGQCCELRLRQPLQ
jgi:hypothetical protein